MVEGNFFVGRIIEIDGKDVVYDLVVESALEKMMRMNWEKSGKDKDEIYKIAKEVCPSIFMEFDKNVSLSVLDLRLPSESVLFSNLPPHRKLTEVDGDENQWLVLRRPMDYKEAMFVRDYL